MVLVRDCRALKKSMYTIYLIDVHNIMNKIRLEWWALAPSPCSCVGRTLVQVVRLSSSGYTWDLFGKLPVI